MTETPPIFDEAVFTTLKEEVSDTGLWGTLLSAFRDELSWRTDLILEHLRDGDLNQVESNAHGIKSVAATYGFPKLVQASQGLELAAKGRCDIEASLEAYQTAVIAARAKLRELD